MAATLTEALAACGFTHRQTHTRSYAHTIYDSTGNKVFRGAAHEVWAWLKDFLDQLPTVEQGHYDDLKIKGSHTKVWLSRCGPEDGETEPIQIERFQEGRWVKI